MRKQNDNDMKFRTYVHEMRERKNISKQTIADKLGISRQAMYKILDTLEEGGGSLQSLGLVANALDCEIWELLVPPTISEELKQLRIGRKANLICPHCGKPLNIKIE